MSASTPLSVTVRRGFAAVTVLLAVQAVVLINRVDPYQIGRSYHAVFGWVAILAFWGGIAYLVGSVGYTVLVGHRSNPGAAESGSDG